jgi:hypothetical protein
MYELKNVVYCTYSVKYSLYKVRFRRQFDFFFARRHIELTYHLHLHLCKIKKILFTHKHQLVSTVDKAWAVFC